MNTKSIIKVLTNIHLVRHSLKEFQAPLSRDTPNNVTNLLNISFIPKTMRKLHNNVSFFLFGAKFTCLASSIYTRYSILGSPNSLRIQTLKSFKNTVNFVTPPRPFIAYLLSFFFLICFIFSSLSNLSFII